MGPWKWAVWDAEKRETIALHVDRQSALTTIKQLNENGYVDA
jgi:Mn-dependent DtxR family transcriptional regulator